MKRMIILASALVFAASVTVFGQSSKPATTTTTTSSVKHEQANPASSNTMHASATPHQKTKTMISASELPKAAQDYIAKTYPGKKIEQVEKFTESDGMVKYKAEVGGMYLRFDSNGKLMNEVKKESKPATESKPSSNAQSQPTKK